jgi:antitoxin YefM
MESMNVRAAKAELSALLDRVQATHERVTITRNGHAAAVLISPEDLESLEETLDVLSSPETLRQLREARAEVDRGEGLDENQLRELLTRHGR